MISIVCVYNDKKTVENILLKSLENQTVKFELILLNNVDGRFKSAAESLNYGAKQSHGKYIMFIHQDVELASNSWIESVEIILDHLPDLGVAGLSGMSEKGHNNTERQRGYNSNLGAIWEWARPVQEAEEVQTIDEGVLIVPSAVFANTRFDEKVFDGWHCYGADYCLSIRQLGLKAYVIPALAYHRSLGTNLDELLKYQKRLYKKHRKTYRRIYTTPGEISWLQLKLRPLAQALRPFYMRVLQNWIFVLRRELSGCNTVLDLGCGYDSPIRHCKIPFSLGVESNKFYLDETKRRHIHTQYLEADLGSVEFKPRSFDAVVAFDLLERLPKSEGHRLIKKMEKWAKKKVIITSSNGHLWQKVTLNNEMPNFESSWYVEKWEGLDSEFMELLESPIGGESYEVIIWKDVSQLFCVL